MNIYDIAKMAGVSIATVSRVVNGSSKVSEKTKQKILEVMRENAYTPNVFARGLGLDSMKTIGILCPDISDVFIAKAVSFLEKDLRKYGYDCILACSGYHQKEKEEITGLLLSKRIDALILVGSTYVGKEKDQKDVCYIHEAAEKVPVFLMNGYLQGERIYCYFCDDFGAGYLVANRLLQSGKKEILFLSDSYSYSATKKLEGYKKALEESGLPLDSKRIIYSKNDIHYTCNRLKEFGGLTFDSVFATEDGLAIGAMKYVLSRSLRVPEDVFICGYNNSQLAESCAPELTSVDNRLQKLCRDMVDGMIHVLSGNQEGVKRKNILTCKLVERGTTRFLDE